MPPHLHKHCSAPCGINETTRVQMKTHLHTQCYICTCADTELRRQRHLFSAVAVKYTSKGSSADEQLNMHRRRDIVFYRGRVFSREITRGMGGVIKGQQRKLKVCIILDLCASLQTSLCCYTPLLLFSLYSDTKHEGNL